MIIEIKIGDVINIKLPDFFFKSLCSLGTQTLDTDQKVGRATSSTRQIYVKETIMVCLGFLMKLVIVDKTLANYAEPESKHQPTPQQQQKKTRQRYRTA